MFFVDVNVFVELQLNQKRSDESEVFLAKVRNGEINCMISDFLFYVIVITIENKSEEIVEGIKKITETLGYKGLTFYRPSVSDFQKTQKFMKKYSLDFDDGLVVACMVENNIDTLVSFDKDFDDVKEIKRVEPKDVI